MSEKILIWLSRICAALCLLPIGAVVLAAALGSGSGWGSLAETVLPRYSWNTVQLVLLVALGTGVIGTGAAWLVTVCRFPGVKLFEVLLALPMAFPAYVLAYAYTDLLDHPGAVQTWLRAAFDLGPRDYWFPEIRSLGGVAAMLVLVLYPYVYLLARAAFLQQSFGGYTAARVLGQTPLRAFLRVSLPMARPAIAGGLLLVVMETIADYGTVAYFGVQTFATGIYQAWFSLGDRAAAAQLALCLLSVALLLAVLERIQRGAAKRYPPRASGLSHPVHDLRGWQGWGAALLCALPVLFGFLLPVLLLGNMAAGAEQDLFSRRYLGFMRNSLVLAGIAAILTVTAAVTIGYVVRLRPGHTARLTQLVAGLGYAVPGGVIAVGLMVPLAAFDNGLDGWMRTTFGISTGLLLTGSIAALVVAYMVRFMAAALSAFDSGIATVNPSVDAAARTLGRSPGGMIVQVHLPLIRTSLWTGLLIVFVDVMKELPATLIMRPFNFDTLAVQAHRLASDERLQQAAVPSLVIAAFGLVPVVLLCRTIMRARYGRAAVITP
ncbi:ABC transporter permease [Algicella marina]|uniref:ABC transporter permease subunit n=1 Tax=Algicella marina TaxID=2683284 RepID=A0A6P1T0G8_9RHOB|nr:iron ABC transporter permease [Algicella marina]QHQ35340.1 ABC transporter permease subunit [Algicella marina]